MKNVRVVVISAGLLLSVGCQSTLYSDSRLASDTAGVLGVSANEVTISDRRSSGISTYYTAKTKSGEYSCATVGGSVMNAGVSLPPSCSGKGEPVTVTPFGRHGRQSPTGAPPATQSPEASLSTYDVQRLLKDKGYNPGPLDGVHGKSTVSAIKQFQADKQLPVSGNLDQETIIALKAP